MLQMGEKDVLTIFSTQFAPILAHGKTFQGINPWSFSSFAAVSN